MLLVLRRKRLGGKNKMVRKYNKVRLVGEVKLLDILDKKGFLSKKGKNEFKRKARILAKGLIKACNSDSTKKKIESKFKNRFKVKL